MKIYTNLSDSYNDFRDWFMKNISSFAEEDRVTLGRMFQLGQSPVDTIVNSAELMYAKRDQIDVEGKEIAAGLFRFAADNGFHGLAEQDRGGLAAKALETGDFKGQPDVIEKYRKVEATNLIKP